MRGSNALCIVQFLASMEHTVDHESRNNYKSDQRSFQLYISTWLVNMDRSLIKGVVFLDLEKAFDTVYRDVLGN